VGLARRRAGSVIADPAEVVLALQAAVVQGLVPRHSLGQSAAVGRNVVDHPVDKGLTGGVRVVYYQGDGLCAFWDTTPYECRGAVLPIEVCSTGMLLPSLKASEEIEICFIMVSSFVWVSCSGWSDIHPEDNYFDFLSCITIFPPSNEPVAL